MPAGKENAESNPLRQRPGPRYAQGQDNKSTFDNTVPKQR